MNQQENLIIQELVENYLSILKFQNSVNLAKAYVNTNKAKYQQIEGRFNLSLASRMDYLESKVSLEQSEILLKKQESMLNLAYNKILKL